MELDPQTISPQHIYKSLIGCVVPQLIAWISNLSSDGVANLAPFNLFMGARNEPFTLAFSSEHHNHVKGKNGHEHRTHR